MKRFLLLLITFCSVCGVVFSQNGRIPLTPSTQKSGALESSTISGFSTTFTFNSIESNAISNEKGNFSEIYIDGSFPYGEVGSPSLPMITRMIAIPQGATPVVTVNNYSETEYLLEDYGIETLSAKQAPVRKDVDPTEVEYVVNEAAYTRNAYTTDEIASIEYLGTVRGIRLGKLTVRPVAYNASAKSIKVYNDVNVSVSFENANAALTQSMFDNTYSPAFNSVYDQLINKDIFGHSTIKGVYDDYPDKYNTPVRMLVICYSGFENNASLNEWLAWKLQKGYYVDIFYTDETGTSSSAIASFIQTKYNESVAAGNAYTYLITIGDIDQIPYYGRTNIDSSVGYCAYDIGYSSTDYSSGDYFPEMFYSRISVENATHLANYISKVLTYERFEFTDGGDYLNNLILVGGWDSSWTSRVAGPTVNYAKTNYFNTSNTTYGGFEDGTISTTISTSSTAGYSGTNNGCYNGINNGVCFLNYTAHGDKQEWYQPKLSATQVATLTNTGKYFFGVGNCCLTGNFNNTTTDYSPGSEIGTTACFAETMIRVPDAGAIAYVGCSPYSYWYEDFYWGVGAHSYTAGSYPSASGSTTGVYDAMFIDEYWNSASSLLFLGNLAVASAEESGYQTSVGAEYYFQYYHTFGDGSVMPYITKPEENSVTLPSSVMTGATSMTVNAVAGSYVAVTDNESTIYGVAVANSSGVATVNFTESIPASGTLYVVVTRQQYQPYFGTVNIAIANEPFVSIQSYSPANVSFGTTNDLSITLANAGGVATTGNTTVNLSTTDEYLTLNTASATFGAMAAQGGTATSDAFNFTVAENTPDGHVATINAAITNGSYSWEGTMTVTVAGPACDAPTGLNVALNGSNATITWDTQTIENVTISDDFEDHTAFTINSAGTVGWTYIDGDESTTGAIRNYSTWTNAYSEMAFIVFNPTQVQYTNNTSQTLASRAGVTANSGSQFIASFYASTPPNDDWIVSPELNYGEDFSFSFYCRGGHGTYTETFEVLYSTTTNDQSSFTNTLGTGSVTGGSNVSWTHKEYSVPAAAKYVAIRCTSDDQYYFCVDDITISGNVISGVAAVNLYDNGVLVASNLTDGTYAANNLSVGEHCFSIRSVCDDNSESMSAQSCVTVESTTPSYSITINSDSEGGSVSPNGTQTVYEGDDFTFTVTPDNCYEVASVTVDGASVSLNANNSYTISNVTANHTVNATFSQISYTIVASAGNGGTITPAGNVEVNCGGNQTFAIAANNGYRIVDVTVDGQSQGAIESYTFSNVTEGHTISATFIAVLEININADAEGGSVSPTGTQTVDAGESFTFTVTPDNCYEVASVTVNGSNVTLDANNSYTITNITADQNVNVTFSQISYTIVASAGNGGTITPAGNIEVNCGENQTFAIAANNGYRIVDVTVDGQSQGAIESYTFSNVTEGHTISATFIAVLEININADAEGGSVSPTGTQTVDAGESFTFTVTPDNCYEVASVTVNGSAVTLDANNSYTITNITSDQNVNVTFSQISYTIVASAGNGGTITPAGNVEVSCGESQTFAIAPANGYMISDVLVDGQSIGTSSSYTFSNVSEDHTISTTFEVIPAGEVVIVVDADAEGGSVSPTGTQTITEGDDFTFTVTPDNCYEIGEVTVNGTAVTLDANNSYTISNVTTEQNINVSFNQITYTIVASAANGGTITPAGNVEVGCGESMTFAIAAAEGYEIADVTVDGQSVGAVESYTFSNLTADHTISATFSASIEINIDADSEGGSVSPTGTQTITEGDDFTFTVTPDNCYEIGEVTVNGSAVTLDANNSYTITNITTDQDVNVTFNLITYTIAASAGNGGTITPAGDVEVNCGENMTFAIAASEGYEIADVTVDGQSVGAVESYTFNNVSENGHSIVATFSEIVVVPCNAVTDLAVSVEPYGNMISWTAAENAISYNIYRNNETNAIATVSTTSYVDVNGAEGDSYYIVTVCQDGESEACEPVVALPTSIDENSISVELYPNPTNGNFMIECNEMTTVEIFNMVGQLVDMIETNSNAISVDASAWTSGVYNVRITTSNTNIIVKKIVKQ